MDCKVSMDGYEVLRQWMSEHTELDAYSFITIQSMASSFMLKPGCYDNVYQIFGVIQQVITKCVVGGRVMANSNKQYHVKKKIADFDACSLYPSAMYVIGGFFSKDCLMYYVGDTSNEFLKQQDGFREIIMRGFSRIGFGRGQKNGSLHCRSVLWNVPVFPICFGRHLVFTIDAQTLLANCVGGGQVETHTSGPAARRAVAAAVAPALESASTPEQHTLATPFSTNSGLTRPPAPSCSG